MVTKTFQHFVLILAAGLGIRIGGKIPKQYLLLAGKPMLQHSLDIFVTNSSITHTYIVVNLHDSYIDNFLTTCSHLKNKITILRCGSDTRYSTVLNSLQAIRDNINDNDWILVHDAARPGLDHALLNKLLFTLDGDPVGGLLALPVRDTLKSSIAQQYVQKSVPRENLWAAQTPQMFRYALLQYALIQAQKQNYISKITDDASAIEMLGLQPKLIESNLNNFKVTLANDIALASLLLKKPK